jgi:hypothetical protein
MAEQARELTDNVSLQVRRLNEDWLAVAAGLLIFALSLGFLFGNDLLGWATAPQTWLDVAKSVRPTSQAYAQFGQLILILATFAFALVRDDDRARLSKEMRAMRAEPLLPIETRLIAWSLIAGAVLLVVLLWTGVGF